VCFSRPNLPRKKLVGRKEISVLTVQSLTEKIPILRDLESPDRGTEDLDSESIQDSHLVELDSDVESGLTSEGEEDTIGTFLLEDGSDVVCGDGEEVDFGGEVVRGLDGRDVGVDEDGFDVGLLESFDGLGTWRNEEREGRSGGQKVKFFSRRKGGRRRRERREEGKGRERGKGKEKARFD